MTPRLSATAMALNQNPTKSPSFFAGMLSSSVVFGWTTPILLLYQQKWCLGRCWVDNNNVHASALPPNMVFSKSRDAPYSRPTSGPCRKSKESPRDLQLGSPSWSIPSAGNNRQRSLKDFHIACVSWHAWDTVGIPTGLQNRFHLFQHAELATFLESSRGYLSFPPFVGF